MADFLTDFLDLYKLDKKRKNVLFIMTFGGKKCFKKRFC